VTPSSPRNAAFVLGQRSGNGIDISMPYSATLTQSCSHDDRAGSLRSAVVSRHNLKSHRPHPSPCLPPWASAAASSRRWLKRSRPDQSHGRRLLAAARLWRRLQEHHAFVAQAPTVMCGRGSGPLRRLSSQASIESPPHACQRNSRRSTAPPIVTSTGGTKMPAMPAAASGGDTSQCFDLVVIRQTPKKQLPISCGGTRPN